MKSKVIICILMSMALLNTASAAGEGGVNIEPVVEETIFSEITHTETSTDLEDWEITMTLNSDAASNNTTFELVTQICNNDGVCFAPTTAELSTDEVVGSFDEKNGKRFKIEGFLEEFALTRNEAESLITNARNIIFK